jgi:hypothetical protein
VAIEISDEGAAAHIDALRRLNTSVTNIDLSSNEIGASNRGGITALINAHNERHRPLQN